MANAQLHDALKCLRPKDFVSDVPADDLETFMRDIFANGEIIVHSVPQPLGGTDFLESKRKRTDVNGAHNASEMTISDARAPPFDPSFEELQKSWGKPMKQSNNPLSVSVFKMAGADRYGSWFARRSVHEGLGFTKWKKALQREFAESLAVQGGPGVGSIRGIGGDKRLEKKVVDGVGKLEVLQLSAKFPAPTAPREFVTMLLTSDHALSSIVADTSKFLNWACAMEDIPDPEEDEYKQPSLQTDHESLAAAEEEAQPRTSFSAASRDVQLAGVGTSIADLPLTDPSAGQDGNGLFSSFTNAVGNGIQNYAPQSVASYLQPTSRGSSPFSESDEHSETSSLRSFASAEQWATAEDGTGEETPPALPPRHKSSESLSSTVTKSQANQERYEKELSKIDSKRAQLDDKMRKTREREEARTQQNTEREEREKRKAVERYEREMAKLEAKREKEARKLEQRKKKEEEKNTTTRLQRERDEFKFRAEMAERENRLLKEQVGELQQQNTLLVQRIGKTEQGQQALKAISDELSRGRSGSTASSSKSKNSKKSAESKNTV
ncbi:hypothetical protein GTA08_BOTSDO03435 [Neofusicoccum parvum]|uniref:Uncharacterized protein n=1 Tax=Neofusicoccum parvum TaxID=310453 RepID=A0ACB5RXK6_9PEZI|nr:hypothetical protein GTA08_BOTSDO03435 [Neofusicoccum parvum]